MKSSPVGFASYPTRPCALIAPVQGRRVVPDEIWLPWANLGALALSVAINLWIYLRARGDQRWETLQRRQQRVESRLSALEVRVESLPTQDDLIEIRDRLGHIDKTTAGLEERSSLTLSSVRRIEQYLMESSKR